MSSDTDKVDKGVKESKFPLVCFSEEWAGVAGFSEEAVLY